MDYDSLLQLAKLNSDKKKEAKRTLPNLLPSRSADLLRKQEVEKKRLLDANVARFLAKRQDDERKKQNAANRKRDELLALRNQDAKARKRVKVMNKSAKSADKSAIQDAVGPSDYYIIEEPLCFMSQESLAQEEKFLEKMYNDPHEEKFSKGKSNTNKDLNGTKDRVKQALKMGELFGKERNCDGHREKKKERCIRQASTSNEESDEGEPAQKVARQPRPPPMNYQELLKLAEKLQQEPVKEMPLERETVNRPMTAKQREEFLCEEASRRRKEEGWREEARLKKMGKLPQTREYLPNSSLPRIPKKNIYETEELTCLTSLPRIPKRSSGLAPAALCQKTLNHREENPNSKQTSRPTIVPRSVDQSKTVSERHNGSNSKHSSIKAKGRESISREVPSIPKHSLEKERSSDKFSVSSSNQCSMAKSLTNKSPTILHKLDSKVRRQEATKPFVQQSKTTQSSRNPNQLSPTNTPRKTLAGSENKRAPLLPAVNSKFGKTPFEDARVNAIRHLPPADLKTRQCAPSGSKPLPSAVGTVTKPEHINARPPKNPNSRPSSDVRPRTSTSLEGRQSSDVRYTLAADTRPRQLLTNDRKYQQALIVKTKQSPSADVHSKQFPLGDVRRKQFPPADVEPKQFPPADVRPKQFPPADVRDRGRMKANMKRRIIESDDDYDSEDAAFIDDGPDESGEDYSKYIKEIFGYDKNRYKGIDDSDDRGMESSFQQQLKEEFKSTKQGILEDLEDIQKEKRREAMVKKKRKTK